MGKDPVDEPFTEDEKVTAPVTDPPRAKTPWEEAGMSEELWNAMEIPPFLRRTDTTTTPVRPATTQSARTTSAVVSAGNASGEPTKPATPTPPATVMPGATGNFEQFRVDPEEIESKIRHEADRRWRAWVPTKEHLSRPRKSYYLKQVRKEFYK